MNFDHGGFSSRLVSIPSLVSSIKYYLLFECRFLFESRFLIEARFEIESRFSLESRFEIANESRNISISSCLVHTHRVSYTFIESRTLSSCLVPFFS